MHVFRSMHLVPCFLLCALVVGLTACDEPAEPASNDEASSTTVLADTTTIASVLQTDDRFTTLATAVDSTGLDSTLAADGPFTLFAPTNDAFDQLPEGTVSDLLDTENQERLRTILLYHVLGEEMRSESVTDVAVLTTMKGSTVPVSADDQTLRVGAATVLDGDIITGNGVIHVIDTVLRPPADDV